MAQEALQQIELKHYTTALKQHSNIKTVLKVGLAFVGKTVVLQSATLAL